MNFFDSVTTLEVEHIDGRLQSKLFPLWEEKIPHIYIYIYYIYILW